MQAEKKPLPAASPERAGLPSQAVEAYVRALDGERLALHSLLIARKGQLIFEGYWKPMDADFRHRLYSCSKSFVSCAVGLLIEQGLLRLEDKAIGFFPDKAPENPHPYLARMTVRDLLMMATCYEYGASYHPCDNDWEATFFTDTISHPPGMVFSYCTTATTMLCMIIKRVSGKEFTEVLRPVFDELGISRELYCIQTPCGHEWGGSGVMATSREFMKFALLCMRYGEYEGRQLLPRDYMIQATACQIDNSLYHASPDEAMGYGYQFWRTRHNGFAFYGMGCQYAICLPDQDLVVLTTGYEQLNAKATREIFSALWRGIYPNLSGRPLPENPEAHGRLLDLAQSLELVKPQGAAESETARAVQGRRYRMDENPMGMEWVEFSFSQDEGRMRYQNRTGEHELAFGLGRHLSTRFPETHYNGPVIGRPLGRGLNCLNSAAWISGEELMIYCQVVDMHLAQLRLAVRFKGNEVCLNALKNAEFFMDEYQGFASGRAE